MEQGSDIGLRIDQILQQDATGTLIMLELEAMGIDRIKAETAVQYVDHNLLQTDFRNADDHRFLQTASARFGYWYSRSGNGISHAVHMERFGRPGKTLLGSDSHTCAGGGIGMLAIGTGGLDVALAAAGKPYYIRMPKIRGIRLSGKLPPWLSAKDIILEMLRRYDVNGNTGYIVEYFGEGLANLSAWDRHVIANMGAELGATTTVFPSDENTRFFLRQQKRENEWTALYPDSEEEYDEMDEINLSELVPLIATPSSPGNVVFVSEVSGREIGQVVIGSSANPGLRDFSIVAEILKNKQIHESISLDINPSSRQTFQNLTQSGRLAWLISSGARLHQTGCMGCIGMGQAPSSGSISLRTMPRNFPGRSGTLDDLVYLCSPETAAASALTGKITDPRDLENLYSMTYPVFVEPEEIIVNEAMLKQPPEVEEAVKTKILKGPNIKDLPEIPIPDDEFKVPVLLKMNDNISTDEILRAGSEVLPFRSNIDELSKYSFQVIDRSFYSRAKASPEGHVVVAGENYAQGSSREHAALCPRYLGQRAVIAKSYARIGWQNLSNFGILPLEFVHKEDYDIIEQGDIIQLTNIKSGIRNHDNLIARIPAKCIEIELSYSISKRQREILLMGGLINFLREEVRRKDQ
jgi:aconitate hydratase